MSFQADPYVTLGVAPGATLNEVRSAYRRLAKKYHPDAAGERALPRFLAIRAAYEALVDDEGRLRAVPRATPGPRRPGPAWSADPDRARATRQAYRARRAGPTGGTGQAGADAGGPGDAGGAPEPGGGAPGGADAGGRGGGTGRDRRHRRERTATPGSTTYDEAAEQPLDPEWAGAGWYGQTSNTYWTINPREYADPRKHGPEYAARARRAMGLGDAADPDDPRDERDGPDPFAPDAPAAPGATSAAPGDEAEGAQGEVAWDGAAAGSTAAGGAEWRARGWQFEVGGSVGGQRGPGGRRAPAERATEGGPGRARRRAPRGGPRMAGSHRAEAWRAASSSGTGAARSAASRDATDPTAIGPDLEALARRASPGSLRAMARRGDPGSRLLLALVAWPPLGLAASTALETATGCAGFAAGCEPPASMLPLVVQPVIVAFLAALPAVAAPAAFAALAALAFAVPATVVFAASGVQELLDTGRSVLGTLVAAVYLVGLGAALMRSGPLAGPPRS